MKEPRGLNPYEPKSQTSIATVTRRPVALFFALTGFAILVGILAFVPAAFLLNEQIQVIPTQISITEFEFNGRPVSPKTVVRYSIIAAGSFWFVAILCLAMAVRNLRLNRSARVR
jgi:hypothetical protein